MAYYDRFWKKKTVPKAAAGATRKNYGNTWWGKQWLNALSEIDYGNRLPRGKSYANKGLVQNLIIDGSQISAMVQGSAPRPYKVDISVPKFTEEQQRKLLQVVTENPLFLSQLLNRELPPELEAASRQQGVPIFPRKWDDLKGKCSCPDWAVPCKHMAAVLYVMANEIDNNPFTVFDLHQFDLLGALQKAGYAQTESQAVSITAVQQLQQPLVDYMPDRAWDEVLYTQLDFSTLPDDLSTNLLRLLTDKPVFYPQGNFKTLLSGAYKAVAREARAELPEEGNLNEEERQMLLNTHTLMVTQHANTGQFWALILMDTHGQPIKTIATFTEVLSLLNRVNMVLLSRCAPAVRALSLVYRFAEQLAQKGAWVPQILSGSDQAYRIRAVPALLNDAVRDLSNKVDALVPPGLFAYVDDEGGISDPIDKDRLSALVGVFLKHFLSQAAVKIKGDGLVPGWFLSGGSAAFTAFETRGYPLTIHLWLSRFFIAESSTVPVFEVLDHDDTFTIRVRIEDKNAPLQAPVPLDEVLAVKKYAYLRLDSLRQLSMVSAFFPSLATHVSTKGTVEMRFNAQEFVSVFFEALPIIRLFGIRVLLPKALQKMIHPAVSARLRSNNKVEGTGLLSLSNMIAFDWQVALGNQMMNPQDFIKMVKGLRGIVRIADGYAYFDDKQVAALLEKIANPPALSAVDLLQMALTENYEGTLVHIDDNLRQQMQALFVPGAVALPHGLQAHLRPYQQRGYEWLFKNVRLGFGSLIADDMGLGKTLQVIATLLKMKQNNLITANGEKALVVVPTTLLTNWNKEIARFAPELAVHTYHGPGRTLVPLANADLLLTTYGVLRTEITSLNKQRWAVAVLDEAQNIKNLDTAQTKAVRQLKAEVRIAMTGTPVENRLSEYFSIFDFANRGLLGTAKSFKTEFARPIERERNQAVLQRFQKITAHFLLRRLKTDKSIISDLPDKVEINEYCTLSTEQAALYQNVVETALRAIENEGDAGGIRREGLVLKMLTTLKQVCNHPAHYLKKQTAEAEKSGKTQRLLDLLAQIEETGEKTLIFTQYEEMGQLLRPLIAAETGILPDFLHGGCSRKQRDEMVDRFQTQAQAKVLLLSLKAGGTGLNLTAASNVIHYDLWWNPAVEAQATDRAYRIGQNRNVQVHRFITQGTLEEKINEMIQSKKALANLTVAAGERWIGDLSNAELKELVRLG